MNTSDPLPGLDPVALTAAGADSLLASARLRASDAERELGCVRDERDALRLTVRNQVTEIAVLSRENARLREQLTDCDRQIADLVAQMNQQGDSGPS